MEGSEHTEGSENKEQQVPEFEMPKSPIMVILVGLIGSGKTTFSTALQRHYPTFVRCNQDDLGNRKKVEKLVTQSLSSGKSVVVDRTNIDARQRSTWINLARTFSRVSIWVVTMNTPYEVCVERVRTRKSHPTIKSWAIGQQVLERFASEYEAPSIMEDFDRMYELGPHPTGEWTGSDISKVLHEIDSAPSTRLEGSKSSLTSDLSLYVGVPLAIAAGAVGIAHHLLSKSRAA